ncbi:hypothetical protein [Streptomyces sp. NPDC051014]|uniref:hypothetical protein n=1 Tax=Streptomyces sp. NPDC051014 TaxID=3155751 RepID=UPI0033C954F7
MPGTFEQELASRIFVEAFHPSILQHLVVDEDAASRATREWEPGLNALRDSLEHYYAHTYGSEFPASVVENLLYLSEREGTLTAGGFYVQLVSEQPTEQAISWLTQSIQHAVIDYASEMAQQADLEVSDNEEDENVNLLFRQDDKELGRDLATRQDNVISDIALLFSMMRVTTLSLDEQNSLNSKVLTDLDRGFATEIYIVSGVGNPVFFAGSGEEAGFAKELQLRIAPLPDRVRDIEKLAADTTELLTNTGADPNPRFTDHLLKLKNAPWRNALTEGSITVKCGRIKRTGKNLEFDVQSLPEKDCALVQSYLRQLFFKKKSTLTSSNPLADVLPPDWELSEVKNLESPPSALSFSLTTKKGGRHIRASFQTISELENFIQTEIGAMGELLSEGDSLSELYQKSTFYKNFKATGKEGKKTEVVAGKTVGPFTISVHVGSQAGTAFGAEAHCRLEFGMNPNGFTERNMSFVSEMREKSTYNIAEVGPVVAIYPPEDLAGRILQAAAKHEFKISAPGTLRRKANSLGSPRFEVAPSTASDPNVLKSSISDILAGAGYRKAYNTIKWR